MIEEKIRPLENVSKYVVETLPSELERVRNGFLPATFLTHRAERLLMFIPPTTVSEALQNAQSRDIGGLDLKMLEAAIVHSHGESPEGLSYLVDLFSQQADQPTGLTYEEIILINPSSDRRRFTTGELGETEADFYEGHRVIEGCLDRAITIVAEGIDSLSSEASGFELVSEQLRGTSEDVSQVVDSTHRIGQQKREHFAQFRPYLGTHPERKTKGPSGAFTAGVPTLELLLAGENLPPTYTEYLIENRMYFPRRGREELKKAMEMAKLGLTLTGLAHRLGDPKPLLESIEGLSQLLRRFRGEHYKTVRNQVPEAITGQVSGTGGETNPGEFLRERMRIRHIHG